jgi:hypothetical protein
MPTREKGESLSKFIGRFVSSKREQKYPIKQRLAIGYHEAKERSRKEHHGKA